MWSLKNCLVALLLYPSWAGAASFTPLGDLSGGTGESYPHAISADGSVIVGDSAVASGMEAFRWTESGGMVGLGYIPGGLSYSTARGVSGDGSVVVGNSDFGGILGFQPFRWTSAGGMLAIIDPPVQGGSAADAVSADGIAVVGVLPNGSGSEEGFRWTSTEGFVELGDLPGGSFATFPQDVSADGSVVVGSAFSDSLQGLEAFRWTSTGGMVGLGELPGGPIRSVATAVSADGSIVVEYSDVASGSQAFRWTSSGGMVAFGDPPVDGKSFLPWDVSADGSVTVGRMADVSGAREAVIWMKSGSAKLLTNVLVANGATGLAGWTLIEATGISADGKWVAGWGINPNGFNEAFRANITPSNTSGGGGTVDGLSLLAVGLIGWRRRGSSRARSAPEPRA